MPRFVFIPDKTPDLRNCGTRRWGAGVDLQVEMTLGLRPVSIVRDGGDGAFILTAKRNTTNTQETELRIHHVSASGIPTSPSVVLSTFSNVWFYEAFLVPSSTGTCIAVFTAAGWGNEIRAQRFDSNLSPLWTAPVALSPTNKGITHVAVASDGNNGALVAFKDNAGDAVAVQAFRVQRISASGNLPWGPSGPVLVSPGTSSMIPFAAPQIAVGPTDFAVVWQGWQFSGPASIFGAWVDLSGALVGGPFTIGTSLELFGLSHRWVASDPGGGFYVVRQSVTSSVALTLSRFDNLATASRWTTPDQVVAGGGTYALAEAGGSGALLATLSPGGNIKLALYNPQSANNLWTNAAAANAATVAVLSPSIPSNPHQMAGGVAVAAKSSGGAILVFSEWQPPDAPRLTTQCFDGAGALFGKATALAGAPGAQRRPLLADMVIPASTPIIVKPAGGKLTLLDPEKDSIIAVWQGSVGINGSSITAQKLGCCKPNYSGTVVTVPEFACGVPIDWPQSLPGNINAIFPCGSPKGTFGLLPVPQLALVPGANLPGGLSTRNVPAPQWVRMWFENVPSDVTIELRSHKNQVVGAATALDIPDNVKNVRGQMSTLTFRPTDKLSYALIFNRPREGDRPAVVPIGLRMEFGNGETPPMSLPGRRVPSGAKTARRAATKSTARKSAKTTRARRKK
jgi:hypothetical protein